MYTIILDRGHGLLDRNGKYTTIGKQAMVNGTMVYEGELNKLYVKAIAKYAKAYNLKIEYTVNPDDSKDISLSNRVAIANKIEKGIFISIHNNAANGKGYGTEVFTTKGQNNSDKLATDIINAIKKELPKRKIRTDLVDCDEDKEALFFVLKHCKHVSVLIEYGFFDNPDDYVYIKNPVNIDAFAKATVFGIMDYLKIKR